MEALSSNTANSLLESLGGGSEANIPAPKATPSTRTGVTTSTEERALILLGSGVGSEAVASALGVTPSRIAQLLSEEGFSNRVSELRYENLQKHNVRDNEYDSIEDELLEKLRGSLPLMFKPELILKAINVVNGAKRKGQSAPEQVVNQQNIVNLILPEVIAQKFSIDINNQVIRAGEQELLTMPAGNLLKKVESAEEARLLENTPTSNKSDDEGEEQWQEPISTQEKILP